VHLYGDQWSPVTRNMQIRADKNHKNTICIRERQH
jgi:hypothetical protein